ncbi:MAG: trypsin-like serine protease [Verrucomicrobiota bacterium]
MNAKKVRSSLLLIPALLATAVALAVDRPTESGRIAPTREVARIVGGSTAPVGAYPWMTALVARGYTAVNGQFCGGALIHPQWVLTAGHCVDGATAGSMDVVVGAHDLRNTSQGVRIGVTQIIRHPQYGTVNGELANDFALLKLAQPATGVTPLGLVDQASQVAAGTAVRAIGWGTTSENGSSSPVLLQVDMGLIALDQARLFYPGLSSVHLAAGVAGGGKDTCQCDSGGPLLVSDGKGGWLHAGAVSYGEGCARPEIPGIYANTLTFRSWILQQIGVTAGDDHSNMPNGSTTLVLDTPMPGRLETAGDIDVFQLILTQGGTVVLTSSGTTDVVGSLSNTAGTVLAQDDNGAGAPNFQISSVVPAGIYYVAVRGNGSVTGAYTVLAKFTPTPTATGQPEIAILGSDKTEIADGLTSSSVAKGTDFGILDIASGSRTTVFTVKNTGKAALSVGSVRLEGPHAAQFRIATQPATSVAAGRAATFSVVYDPNAVGTHTAELVIPNNDADENPYNVTLTGVGTSTSSSDDHGNTTLTATRVAIPSSTVGILGGNDDRDVFQFTLTQTTTVTIRTTGPVDTYGTLVNATGRVLAEQDDYGTTLNFRIRRSLSAGTYFIAVEGYEGTEQGTYKLEISR